MFVFAYGSLMWRPGFPVVRSVPALVRGWHRSWCIDSVHHRGSPDNPGAVLGLLPGGRCVGMCLEADDEHKAQILNYLDERELVEPGYRRTCVDVEWPSGKIVQAYAYICEAKTLSAAGDDQLRERLAHSSGVSGRNIDYALETHVYLSQMYTPRNWPRPCCGLPEAFVSSFFRSYPRQLLEAT